MMKTSTVDTWIWTLLYGGLLVLSLSLFVARRDGELATLLQLGGGVATAASVALFIVRTRMKDGDRE